MKGTFLKGDKVCIKALSNRIGIIDGEPRQARDKLFYPVCIDPAQQSSYYPEDSLKKFIPPKSIDQLLKSKEFATKENFIQGLIYKKLDRPLADNLYTFYASRTEFLVHQFKPVLKFLNTAKQRLLLADEVGLGKTIEAGIIITELAARIGELSRVLVVCPSMLIQKWQREMQRRFGLEFKTLKRNDFVDFLQKYKEYWEAEKLKGICSLQTLRAKRMIELLREVEPHFDIVIVDEAHYMRNPDTQSSELGEVLGELSDAVLFLSATPLQLGTSDLFNLLRLLVPEEFSDFLLFHDLIEPNDYINNALRRLYSPSDALNELKKVENTSQGKRFAKNPYYLDAIELLTNNKAKLSRDQAIRLQKLLIELNCLSYIFTRTKKKDVETQFPTREARVIRVEFTQAEMDFYNAVTNFVAERFTTKYGSSQGISFAVIMPQRQVASCIQAMKQSLDWIVKKRVIKAPTEDNGDIIDPTADIESPWKLEDNEVSAVKRLLSSANRIKEVDTKFDMFLKALRELEKEDPEAKILVFAFFKKTLEYLRRSLERTEYSGKVALIHGDIHREDRERIIKKFREIKEIKILLSSEIGGEGLDFEFCNVIFNYDLPWNPMRVEQRIGRLDRYGQRHEKILIYNFSMIGTIDDEILSRLYRRINIFERYIGDLEAILGDQITELTREMFNTRLTHEQKIQKIEKIAENMARRQKDLEEFETECQKFIGQDEYFNQEISRILETKKFITSAEVKFFLQIFLKNILPKTTMLPPKSGRQNVFVLKADDSFRTFFRQYALPSDNIKEVERKLSFDGGLKVTFDSQEACRDESLEFLTIHHPIIKAIKRYYDENKQEVGLTTQLVLKGNKNYLGRCIFFIYLLEKTALKKDLILLPVLVNLSNGEVHILDDLCNWFLAEVINAETISEDIADYSDEQFDQIFKEAGEFLGIIREEEEQRLKRSNNILVNNQVESVKQANVIKVKKAEEIIRKLKLDGRTDDDSIVRLYRGKIRNLEMALEGKIKSFEEKRAISVSFALVTGGVAKIEP